MTTDELADRVEAGLRAGATLSQANANNWGYEGVWVSKDITDALAALADYRKRVQALEAFVGKWAAFEFAEITMSEEVWEMQHKARALLAGSEGGE